MAISVNWTTKVITVPKADTTLLVAGPPQEIREYDLNAFRLELKALEAGEGMPFLDTHSHNTQVTVGGVTLARVIEIINGYTITFEDGQYAVNLFGANSNAGDVVNVNQVSIRSANSAGLINIDSVLAGVRYQGFVWLSETGTSGFASGVNGIPGNPVDNIPDALTIASANSLQGLHFLDGSWTLAAALQDFEVISDVSVTIDLGSQDVSGTRFEGGTLTGTMTGGPTLCSNGKLDSVSGWYGDGQSTGIKGTIALGVGESTFHFPYSLVAGSGRPTLDFVGAGRQCSFRGYQGGLDVANMTDVTNVSTLDFISGALTILDTCSGGELLVRGIVGPYSDQSTGTGVTVDGRLDPLAVTDVWQLLGLDPAAEVVIDEPTGDGVTLAGSQAVGDMTLRVTRENGGTRIRLQRVTQIS